MSREAEEFISRIDIDNVIIGKGWICSVMFEKMNNLSSSEASSLE